jgi:hypothetical protein
VSGTGAEAGSCWMLVLAQEEEGRTTGRVHGGARRGRKMRDDMGVRKMGDDVRARQLSLARCCYDLHVAATTCTLLLRLTAADADGPPRHSTRLTDPLATTKPSASACAWRCEAAFPSPLVRQVGSARDACDVPSTLQHN